MSPKVTTISSSPGGATRALLVSLPEQPPSSREAAGYSFEHFISPNVIYVERLPVTTAGGQMLPLPYNPEFSRSGGFLAYDDLRTWIAALERAGELKTIRTEVDPILEISEITDRASKGRGEQSAPTLHKTKAGAPAPGGPALLFQNIKGHPGSQVLINQFGSARRMNLALEVDSLDQVADRIRHFMDVKSPQGFLDKVKMLPRLAEMGKFFPKTIATGPCKEVIRKDNFSLDWFPILQCWPKDAGRFITLPCVVTRDPKTGKRNVGCYRMQVYDERPAAIHWQRQKIGAEHYREALR